MSAKRLTDEELENALLGMGGPYEGDGIEEEELVRGHITAITARNQELEGALRSIAANACCGNCQEAALWAKAALKEAQDD